jgi:hypothetical protein
MKVFALLVMLFLMSCSGSVSVNQSSPSDNPSPHKEASLRWKASELIGYTYTLVDDKAESQLRFTDHGTILYSGGPKGGPYTAPILYWAIDDKGILNMGGARGFTSFSWIKLEDTGDRVIVESSGRRRIYVRSKD